MSHSLIDSPTLFQQKNEEIVDTTKKISSIYELTKEKNTIFFTKDYKLFIPHPLQRSLQPRNLEKLRQSISRHNLLEQNPLKVVRSHSTLLDYENPYYIWDGNHRAHCCRESDLGYYFTITPQEDFHERDLIDTGYALSRWAIPQFLQYYVKKGKDDYIRFERFVKDFNLDVHTGLPVSIAQNKRKHSADKFREGEYRFENENEIRTNTALAKEFLLALVANSAASQNFLSNSAYFDGYTKIIKHPQFSQSKMLKSVSGYGRDPGYKLPQYSAKQKFYEWFKYNYLKISKEKEL